MRYQDYIVESTLYAAKEAFKYAKAVPADKLDWKPLDAGRSVLALCKEMAQCAGWSEMILTGKAADAFGPEAMEAAQKAEDQWTTVEACEAECMRQIESYLKVVRDFPDDRMDEKFTLPFDGGQEINMRENMDYPRWNFTYHQGQIAYIQTLYGDAKMYW